jgi:hypothetical protein
MRHISTYDSKPHLTNKQKLVHPKNIQVVELDKIQFNNGHKSKINTTQKINILGFLFEITSGGKSE